MQNKEKGTKVKGVPPEIPFVWGENVGKFYLTWNFGYSFHVGRTRWRKRMNTLKTSSGVGFEECLSKNSMWFGKVENPGFILPGKNVLRK